MTVFTKDGKPLTFYLSRFKTRETIKQFITSGGGLICDLRHSLKIPKNTIYIGEYYIEGYEMILPQFVIDSSVQQSLKDTSQYIVRAPMVNARRRHNYTPAEDELLKELVMKHSNETHSSNGNKIYQLMAPEFPTHTWQSLRNRWVKTLSLQKDDNILNEPDEEKEASEEQEESEEHEEIENHEEAEEAKEEEFLQAETQAGTNFGDENVLAQSQQTSKDTEKDKSHSSQIFSSQSQHENASQDLPETQMPPNKKIRFNEEEIILEDKLESDDEKISQMLKLSAPKPKAEVSSCLQDLTRQYEQIITDIKAQFNCPEEVALYALYQCKGFKQRAIEFISCKLRDQIN